MTETQQAPQVPMKKAIRVTIEKVIEIELMPSMFGGLTEDEYIVQFKRGLWDINGMDDIYTYAARMAAHHDGGLTHDGLGLLAAHYSTYPRVPDVKFRIVEESTEDEIIEGATDTAKRPTIWNDPTGAAESQIWDEGQGCYRSMTDAEHAENNKPETT